MMGLTKRQSEALAFIRGFIEGKGYSPDYREIRAGMGLVSTSQVHAVVTQLAERKAIRYLPGKPVQGRVCVACSRAMAVVPAGETIEHRGSIN